jgi:hypothetical protein
MIMLVEGQGKYEIIDLYERRRDINKEEDSGMVWKMEKKEKNQMKLKYKRTKWSKGQLIGLNEQSA